MSVWESSVGEEVRFWRDWLTKDEFREFKEARLYKPDGYLGGLLSRIGNPSNPKVLDVGSGPISTFYAEAKRDGLDLTCTDPLGADYAPLLVEANLSDLPSILPVKGELLAERFGSGRFDLVHCANALDHFEDPSEGFRQMAIVCKPRGAVSIVSIENEGERENYCGLHQWNLNADDAGLWLKSRAGKAINLIDRAVFGNYEWRYVNEPSEPFRIFEIVAFKRSSALV